MRIFGFILLTTLGIANLVKSFHDVIHFGLISVLSLAIETPITPTSSGRWSA